jgi:peptide/nickel transport system permease protein
VTTQYDPAQTALRGTFPRRQSASRWTAPVLWTKKFARRKPLGFVGLAILVVIGLAAAFAPLLTPYAYDQTNFSERLVSPGRGHIFGTDNLGRDLFSRILYGARVSLGISFASVIVAKALATVIAVISGYYGGWIDKTVQRFVDIWLALPTLIILITLIGAIGASPMSMIIVIALTNTPGSSRLVRSVVIGVREEPYIEAARAMGATNRRTILVHVLPNIAHIIIYSSTVTLGSVILIVASLGFLGYGVPPPHPDLGAMLSGDGLAFMKRMPWMAIWPGLVITLVVFAFNVLGDALRDVLDPRMRGST